MRRMAIGTFMHVDFSEETIIFYGNKRFSVIRCTCIPPKQRQPCIFKKSSRIVLTLLYNTDT